MDKSVMKKEDSVYLRHIINAIEQIERYTRGMSENEFLSRPMVQDAVVRQIEIIGEAAGNISLEFQGLHPKLPWVKTIGIRSKILPEDFGVDTAVVWDAIQDDLPLLKQAIKKLM